MALDLVRGLVFTGVPVIYDGWVYGDSMDAKTHGGALLVLGVYLDSSTKKGENATNCSIVWN